ncbi:MAG TPA: rhodanese-like domain-containing protein [Aequorivita sp.]|nr:rhodanese-like domain-containing protein [Aequorivita sp.]
MADLTQQDWTEQLKNDDNAVIIDVRTDIELEEGYIPGAIQMNIQNTAVFYEDAKKLDPTKNYYVYCRSGGRSGQACVLFNSLGIKNAYNLMGGMLEWKGEITQ